MKSQKDVVFIFTAKAFQSLMWKASTQALPETFHQYLRDAVLLQGSHHRSVIKARDVVVVWSPTSHLELLDMVPSSAVQFMAGGNLERFAIMEIGLHAPGPQARRSRPAELVSLEDKLLGVFLATWGSTRDTSNLYFGIIYCSGSNSSCAFVRTKLCDLILTQKRISMLSLRTLTEPVFLILKCLSIVSDTACISIQLPRL